MKDSRGKFALGCLGTITVLSVVLAAFLFWASGASADSGGITYNDTPVGSVANGTSSTGQFDDFSATLAPGPRPTIPSGAPLSWTTDADTGQWTLMQDAGTAPGLSAMGKIGMGAVISYSGLQSGLWIGGEINKHFLFTGSKVSPVSILSDPAPDDYEMNFMEGGKGNLVGAPYVSGYRYMAVQTNGAGFNDESNLDPDSGDYSCFGGTGDVDANGQLRCYFNGFTHTGIDDLSNCDRFEVSSTGNFADEFYDTEDGQTVCHFNNSTDFGIQVTAFREMQELLGTLAGWTSFVLTNNTNFCYAGDCPYNLLAMKISDADFLKVIQPSYDPDNTTQQNGDTTPDPSWTPATPDTPTVQRTAGTAVTCANSGDPDCVAVVQRDNCALDPSYCPGGDNYPGTDLLKPLANETYTAYIARLTAAGFTGTITDVTEPSNLSGYGPDAVTRVVMEGDGTVYDPLNWPSPDPLVDPTEDIQVRHNDDTATPAPTGGGGEPSAPCESCAIDWSPIENIDYGSKFPFGFFNWISNFLGEIPTDGTCPTLSIGKPAAMGGGSQDISFCNSTWESWQPTVFALLDVFITVCGIVWISRRILFGGGGGDDGGDE